MGWLTQDSNDSTKVQVSGDYDRKGDEPRTDFLIIDRDTGTHSHISIDQEGTVTSHHDYR